MSEKRGRVRRTRPRTRSCRRGGTPNRVQDHHVRVWYALADLYERAGDLPRARELFLRIRRHDAAFADAAERLAALG